MACRSGLIALAAGLALGLGSALALGVVAGEDEAAIVVRPVELVDPGSEDPFDLDPLFSPGPTRGKASRMGEFERDAEVEGESEVEAEAGVESEDEGPSDGSASENAARERTVELAGGEIVTVRVPDAPPLLLHDEDIAFVELAEAAIGEDGRAATAASDGYAGRAAAAEAMAAEAEAEADAGEPRALLGERFAVYAVLSDSGRAAWTPFAADHANVFLLVEIAGRPVDLVRPLGWTRGLRIAVFPDELTRSHFVETLPFDAR